MLSTVQEANMNLQASFSYGLLQVDKLVLVDWWGVTYQLCADTGYCLEDLARAMNDRDGWLESENTVFSTQFDDDNDDKVFLSNTNDFHTVILYEVPTR